MPKGMSIIRIVVLLVGMLVLMCSPVLAGRADDQPVTLSVTLRPSATSTPAPTAIPASAMPTAPSVASSGSGGTVDTMIRSIESAVERYGITTVALFLLVIGALGITGRIVLPLINRNSESYKLIAQMGQQGAKAQLHTARINKRIADQLERLANMQEAGAKALREGQQKIVTDVTEHANNLDEQRGKVESEQHDKTRQQIEQVQRELTRAIGLIEATNKRLDDRNEADTRTDLTLVSVELSLKRIAEVIEHMAKAEASVEAAAPDRTEALPVSQEPEETKP